MTPPGITYRKTAETKAGLLDAGVRLFISGASSSMTSRDVAKEANTNHALIAYHFGSFPAFMEAVFSVCLNELRDELEPVLVQCSKDIDSCAQATVAETLCSGIGLLVESLNGPKGAALLAAITSYGNVAGADIYIRFSAAILEPLFAVFVSAAAKARGVDTQSVEAAVLAQLLLAQSMAFFRGAGLMRSHLGWQEFGVHELAQVNKVFCDSIRRLL